MLCEVLLPRQRHGLSDPMAEEAIGERLSVGRFLGLGLHEAISGETTIRRIWGRVAETRLGDKLPQEMIRLLDGKGLLVKHITLVDANLIEA